MLANLFLLHIILASLASDASLRSLEHARETDLPVDLLHALKVGLGGTLRTKDDILRREKPSLAISTPAIWYLGR